MTIPRTLAAAAAALALLAAATLAAVRQQPAGELYVTFIHTGDEHSAVLPSPLVDYQPPGHVHAADDGTRGGVARLAAALRRLRADAAARGEPVLVTSAGDNVGGTPFAWLSPDGEAAELSLLAHLGYDVITLGNHEFDFDSERLARAIAGAGFPAAGERTALVATNTRAPPDHPLAQLGIRRTHTITLPNGLRVGFIGLLGRGAARFATLAPPVEFADARTAAAAAVAELRAQGVHLVVALTHSGVAEDRELARDVPGIDVILGGHDHVLLEAPVAEGRTVIVHPGAYLRQLFVLQVGYDPATGAVRVRNGETQAPYVVPLDASTGEDPDVAARVSALRARLEARIAELTGGRFGRLDATVARSGFPLRNGPPLQETTLGNFVTDAMRRAVEDATGERVDVAFQANGVLRSDVLPAALDARRGDIAFHDLAGAVGMGTGPDGRPGYPLVSVWLTGDEVRRVLEISVLLSELLRNSYYLQLSGVRMRYDPARAVLLRLPVRGTPIPTGRAVLAAELVRPDGAVELERGDATLYHVVTDYYVASFLPMVGRMLPRLALVPKDRDGRAVDDIDARVVLRDGAELKVWQAVAEYAAAQPAGGDAVPRIDDRYGQPEGRLATADTMPLLAVPAGVLLLATVAVVAWLLRRRRVRRRAAPLP